MIIMINSTINFSKRLNYKNVALNYFPSVTMYVLHQLKKTILFDWNMINITLDSLYPVLHVSLPSATDQLLYAHADFVQI